MKNIDQEDKTTNNGALNDYKENLLQEPAFDNQPVIKINENAPIRKLVPQPVKDVENLVIDYLNQMKNRYNQYSDYN